MRSRFFWIRKYINKYKYFIDFMEISWHKKIAESWLGRAAQGRSPHAVLLIGPPGVGKRAAAAWMVRQSLGIGSPGPLPEYPVERPEHADLRWIEPPEDKATILIDQVRNLVADLGLTSHGGGNKLAVIEPANVMTINAANSLLKTLEEPPGDTLLILVADRVGRLPATIFSRCQRIDFAVPLPREGLAWLDRLKPSNHWPDALRMAGNAPLAAIDALEKLDTCTAMANDFGAVAAGRASPVDVAAGWSKLEPAFVLDWLAQQVRLAIIALTAGRAEGLAIERSVLERMDRRNLFWYLDTINRLRGQAAGSFNLELTLDGLLIDWANGLTSHQRGTEVEGLQWLHAQGLSSDRP